MTPHPRLGFSHIRTLLRLASGLVSPSRIDTRAPAVLSRPSASLGCMSMPPLEEAVSVDEAGIWDAEAIAQVAAATFPLACPQDAAEDDIADFIERTLSAEKFAEYLSSPERIVLEARAGEEIVGYLMAVDAAPEDPAIDAMITARPAIEISKLYVMPGHHGSGISAALMDAIVARATHSACGPVARRQPGEHPRPALLREAGLRGGGHAHVRRGGADARRFRHAAHPPKGCRPVSR